MYDGGNRITTSLCPETPLAPYTDEMQVVPSDCFGAGGSYMMDVRTSMMVVLSQNTGSQPLTVSISGNLGADGGGIHVAAQYASSSGSPMVGFMTSVCQAGNDPSVNHLFVIDGAASPNAVHTPGESTGTDDDSVAGIGPGSPVLYILYASTSGGCHSDDEHQAIFDAAVAALVCSGGEPEGAAPGGEPVSEPVSEPTADPCIDGGIVVTDEGHLDFDSGHGNNEDCRWLVSCSSGAPTVLFTFFNTEGNFDFVNVYNGDTVESERIGRFHGSGLANVGDPPLISGSGSTMLVQFTSDGSVTQDGFHASLVCDDVSSAEPSEAPTAGQDCTAGSCAIEDMPNFVADQMDQVSEECMSCVDSCGEETCFCSGAPRQIVRAFVGVGTRAGGRPT